MRHVLLRFLRPPFLVIESDHHLSAEEVAILKASWERAAAGDGPIKLLVLDKGLHIAYPRQALLLAFLAGVVVGIAIALSTVASGSSRTLSSDVTVVRASAPHPPIREDPSPASDAVEVMETSRPSRFTTQVILLRDDPATILAIFERDRASSGILRGVGAS